VYISQPKKLVIGEGHYILSLPAFGEDNGWMMRGVLCAPEQWFSKCAWQIPRDP